MNVSTPDGDHCCEEKQSGIKGPAAGAVRQEVNRISLPVEREHIECVEHIEWG